MLFWQPGVPAEAAGHADSPFATLLSLSVALAEAALFRLLQFLVAVYPVI